MLDGLLGETGGAIAQFVLALIVVLALIMIAAWVIRRVSGGRFGATQPGQAELEIVDAIVIDQKRRLVLVRHGKLEHLLLIGGGSDEVVERSMIGGIPLAARVQASKSQERAQDDSSEFRPADRFRTTGRYTGSGLSRSSNLASRGTAAAASGLAGAAAAEPEASAEPSTKPLSDTNPKSDSAKTDESAPSPSSDPKINTPIAEPASRSTAPEPAKTADATPTADSSTLGGNSDSALSAVDKPVLPPLPTVSDPPKVPVATIQPPAAPSSPIDDLDLERELEAALELDMSPAPGAPKAEDAKSDSPQLEPLSGLLDELKEPAGTPTPANASQAKPPTGPTAVTDDDDKKAVDKAEPPKTPPTAATAPSAAKTETTPEPKVAAKPDPAPDPTPELPVELSGRPDPIPVSIPSRGPASGATSLPTPASGDAKAAGGDGDQEPLVDLSELLQTPAAPAPAAGATAAETKKADDLDEEMRRLLGEIAGDDDSPDRTNQGG
ncbi:MAG: flagellar biosynthetic protein FliO [Cohaesibacteraceae bacterium]